MTNIYSGRLYQNLVIDNNQLRLQNYDVNRYQKTILQQADQGRREQSFREGLEFHQAMMGDLQTKLNEVTEKLNNLYRRYLNNKVAFRKPGQNPEYTGTSSLLNVLPNVNSAPDTTGYPAGANGILPYDDYDKIRNYTWNPWFGSKAIDQSDNQIIRTNWQQPGQIYEQNYNENGAFWSAITYLWGWDVDRINATYATTDASGLNNVQINVTALQPNKPQYPPLAVGDRFPLVWSGRNTDGQVLDATAATSANYPGILLSGLRPGGVDYSHATDSLDTGGESVTVPVNIPYATGNGNPSNPFQVADITFFTEGETIELDKGKPVRVITDIIPTGPGNAGLIVTDGEVPYGTVNTAGTITKYVTSGGSTAHENVVGHNSINFGWEFDDLPLALEVTEIERSPDGTTKPKGYKVVYDIPPTHPHYESLRVLNGTEPMIIDSPSEIRKDQIGQGGFQYTGYINIPQVLTESYDYIVPGFRSSRGGPFDAHFASEREMPPPKLFAATTLPNTIYNTVGTNNFGNTGSTLVKLTPSTLNSVGGVENFNINQNFIIQPGGSNAQVIDIYKNTFTMKLDSGNGAFAPDLMLNTMNTMVGQWDLNQSKIVIGDYVQFSRAPGYIWEITNLDNFTRGIQINLVADPSGNVPPEWPDGAPGTQGFNPFDLAGGNPAISVADHTRIMKYTGPGTMTPTELATATNYAQKHDVEGMELASPVGFNITNIEIQGPSGSTTPIATIPLPNCSGDWVFDASTTVSMRYRFSVHQNYKDMLSPSDDGLIPGVSLPLNNYGNHSWTNQGHNYNWLTGTNNASARQANGDPQQRYIGNAFGHAQYPFKIGGGMNPGNVYNSPPIASISDVGWSQVINAPIGNPPDGRIEIGRSQPTSPTTDGWYTSGDPELVELVLRDGDPPYFEVYFTGDLNNFQIEISDLTINSYSLQNLGSSSWENGLYVPGNVAPSNANDPTLELGDPDFTRNAPFDASDDEDVINKFEAGQYQFTQINEQYNNAFSASDRNDIIRSPFEFAELNINTGSFLHGEMFLDLNNRRLNLEHDSLEANVEGWAGASYNTAGVTNFNLTADGVANAYNFTADPATLAPGAVGSHPEDECEMPPQSIDLYPNFDTNGDGVRNNDVDIIINNPQVAGSIAYTASDSDPLTNSRRVLYDDEVLDGEAPRASNIPVADADPLTTWHPPAQPGFYDDPVNLDNGVSNDSTGTVDRIAGADNSIEYKVTIPTNDVNVLRKENNLLVNLGSVNQRDYQVRLEDMGLEARTVPSYVTLPRYRVDAGGNIYDRFGKGYYDAYDASPNARDVEASNRIYTTDGVAEIHGQVSNFDQGYDASNFSSYGTETNFADYINNHNRLSMNGDDFNLFDYAPDLNLVDPSQPNGARFGESFVGSLPSNFYYYREVLDQSGGELGRSPTAESIANANNFNNDAKPALNFDGYRSNMSGRYDSPHTFVHNPNMPSWANVRMGAAQQDARWRNEAKTTTQVTWQGFPALGLEPSYGKNIYAPPSALAPDMVTDPELILGNNAGAATFQPGGSSSMVVNMQQHINSGGHLVINELESDGTISPHVVPLPLIDYENPPLPDAYPDYSDGTPTSYTFNAYGAETVTRTGSKYIPDFGDVLDAIDGLRDGNTLSNGAIQTLLAAEGGQFSTTDLPSSWGEGIILHVDDVAGFELDYPSNLITLGDDPQQYRVVYKNADNLPQTLYVLPEGGGVPANRQGLHSIHTDMQVRSVTGQFTVTIVDETNAPNADGQNLRIEYNDNGTQISGRLTSVGISSVSDKVGRIAGDDPRTPGVETNRIGPEIFDSPKGYVQPDAELTLNLVSQDDHGNQKPRKLRNVRVTIESGEQNIPSALRQVYSTDGATVVDPISGATTTGVFNYSEGAGEWPIALFDGDVQVNPETTPNLNFMVGHYQGITLGSTASVLQVTSSAGFEEGQEVNVNGETRKITATTGTSITLDQPLSNLPLVGDIISLGNGFGTHKLKMFLNRSFAMSTNAGIKVELEYEEFEPTGYPPTVNLADGTGRIVTETIGFNDKAPKQDLFIAATNTGDGAGGGPIRITVPGLAAQAAAQTPPTTAAALLQYGNGDQINVNGITRTINTITSVGGDDFDLTVNEGPIRTELGQPLKAGIINQQDYENYLVAGTGRTGGSAENEFTQELKRIIDDPQYKDLFRHRLFENIFVSAAVNDPFNDLIASKLFLNWDRNRREVDIQQTSFLAYFKSI